jgi:transcriptional regulator with XRE-family HTH domain
MADSGESQYRYQAEPRTVVGALLRADREAKGLKQEEVAKKIGIHQAKVSAYERGAVKYPPPERLVEMAKLFGRPDDYYLDKLGWRNGARLVQRVPPEPALVIR